MERGDIYPDYGGVNDSTKVYVVLPSILWDIDRNVYVSNNPAFQFLALANKEIEKVERVIAHKQVFLVATAPIHLLPRLRTMTTLLNAVPAGVIPFANNVWTLHKELKK
jgi:hypothetical protein